MARYYTNVYNRFNNVYVRGYENNKPFTEISHYKPYVFVPKQNGMYRTIKGKSVDKLSFDSIGDAREFLKTYEGVTNMEIYGLTTFPYLFLYDNFHGEQQYDLSEISVVSLDIECAADEGFPDIKEADKEITAISLRKKGNTIVFGCGNYTPTNDTITYVKCKSEIELLEKFLNVWKHKTINPDIITGWNIEFFDIPYLVNRIKKLLGTKNANRLSPWGFIEERKVEFRGKQNQTYNIAGISTLDYYQLYRKFTFGNQESYKLDYIASIELGEKKLDFSEYGSLLELYKRNFQKFIEYNIHDVVLVDKLEDKLKFIELVIAFAYDAKVNYSDVMTTVRPWDIIIHNYLLDRRIVIPPVVKNTMNESLVGGYVKEPKIGLNNWVVSFDLNSLYPHLIMQYNISPETFINKQQDFESIDDIIDGRFSREDLEYSFAANGCMYNKLRQGFLPALMEKMYDDRVKYKNKMIECKKQYEKTKNPELLKDIAKYHNFQLAKKIQLNSAYGALSNQYFRWFNFNHAEAITTSGQLSIRWIEKKMNEFMNKTLKTNNVDYVIASDTDSIYVTMEGLVNKAGITDELKIVDTIDKFCESKVQPYLNDCYKELSVRMNAYAQKMSMKRETIANKGIWKAKKMYILNAWNVEGVQYDKPKLKIQGIEAVRSSTPQACREKIKEALSIIMNGTQTELREFVLEFKDKFIELPFEDVAFPRGVKNLKDYNRTALYDKGSPIHVKASLIFNDLLKKHKIRFIPPIADGDKIKFAYLKTPNPINESVIAAPDELPEEFNLDKYIDRDKQFDKAFVEPLRSITEVIGWDVEQKATLEEFFA